LDVKLIADGYEHGHISILSNITWASFYLQLRDRIGIPSKSLQLFCKVRDTSYVSEPGSNWLQGEKDWTDAMKTVTQAFQCYKDIELEILHKVRLDSTARYMPQFDKCQRSSINPQAAVKGLVQGNRLT
jgi:hypothetical protein